MKIAIVFHSGYGHTAELAKAVARGAQSVAGAEVSLIALSEAETPWAELEKADALIFGSPTYMGSVSAPFKKFMDDSSKAWYARQWVDKIAGGFTNSAHSTGLIF